MGSAGDPLRVLLVDDERLARVGLRRELEALEGVEVVGECADGSEAVRAIRRRAPDVVLLDIQMPGTDGFEVVREVGVEAMPPVVFVTAHDEHALRAFEVDAVDYLLKPVDPERMQEALARVRERTRSGGEGRLEARLRRLLRRVEAMGGAGASGRPSRPDDSGPGDRPAGEDPRPVDRLAVEKAGRISFVDVDDVLWIESAGNYARLHTASGSRLVRRTMKSLQADLDPDVFLRVRRSAIVNMERVDHLERVEDDRYRIRLEDGTDLRSSRRRRKAVSDYLRRHR